MHFEHHTPTRILFGPGVVNEIPPAAKALGARSLVLTGRDPRRAAPLVDVLKAEGVEVATFPVPGEPSVESVRAGVARAQEVECDVVIGFGGGSVLDAGKAIAALLTNGGDPTDYLEVVGKERAVSCAARSRVRPPASLRHGGERRGFARSRSRVAGAPKVR
jgi:alcohol dehydrogenase class IV